MTTHFFPAALKVSGRDCLVVGDSAACVGKAVRLAKAGARVKLIRRSVSKSDRRLLVRAGVSISLRSFSLKDLRNQFFVLLDGRDVPTLAASVQKVCRRRRILLCALDQPEFCDVVNVSIYDRGPLHIAISTDGVAPALSRRIREGLEESLKTVPVEKFMVKLATLRRTLKRGDLGQEARTEKLIAAVDGVQFRASLKLPNYRG